MSSLPPTPSRPTPPPGPTPLERWQRFSAASVRAFHAYAGWLVSITWKKFLMLSFLLLVTVGVVHDIPPFTWRVTETLPPEPPRVVVVPPRPTPPEAPRPPIRIESPGKGEKAEGVDISIGKDGISIKPKLKEASRAASAAASAAQAASAAAAAASSVVIELPANVTNETVREAVAQARRDIEDAVREAKEDAAQAARDAEEARRDAEQAIRDLGLSSEPAKPRTRVRTVGPGNVMMQFTLMFVFASALLKAVYKGRIQAEKEAAAATETAETESLKRQVVEAKMAAMQAQVEPHFLFNTLASIDHLIETDPPRASLMQKNLIALLRASMPTMREVNSADGGSTRDLGRELAVIRPYLEILKVRMEERLGTEIRVSDGLMSAEFPPMMLQSLVENAIKHGLEPKADGGLLTVSAEIVHGKLAVTVADTGLGFGKAATAGTGIGLSNIRERLALLYGNRASLRVTEPPGGGTAVTITVPYQSTTPEGAHA